MRGVLSVAGAAAEGLAIEYLLQMWWVKGGFVQ